MRFGVAVVTKVLLVLTLVTCRGGTQPAPQVAATGTAGTASAAPAMARVELRDLGLATPESILHDTERDLYLVSNINGSPLAADDNGFISTIAPDGKVVALKWIDGARDDVQLDAPKGMALTGGLLYVADITQVRRFDRQTGEQRASIPLPGARFVNDLAATSDGAVFASDSGLQAGAEGLAPSGTGAIWKIVDGKPSVLVKSADLGRPNGLAAVEGGLVVVTFGSGAMYRLDTTGRRTDLPALPTGGLDGVVSLPGGDLLVSSWQGETIYRVNSAGSATILADKLPAPADIGFDARRQRILIPMFQDNALILLPLPPS
ncbi:MAG: hypothetical protein ABIJ09_16160 [Pseudomonadota bacterium]